MGLTAASIIYSPWGRQSGAHFNPSVTLTFLRLGKITPRDALFYVMAQFAGAAAGVALVGGLLRPIVSDPAVNFVATVPGSSGRTGRVSGRSDDLVRHDDDDPAGLELRAVCAMTGVLAACMVAVYITFEAPLSGMSMNPARSFGPPTLPRARSDRSGSTPRAPPRHARGRRTVRSAFGRGAVRCAKLHHPSTGHCHFGCRAERFRLRPTESIA